MDKGQQNTQPHQIIIVLNLIALKIVVFYPQIYLRFSPIVGKGLMREESVLMPDDGVGAGMDERVKRLAMIRGGPNQAHRAGLHQENISVAWYMVWLMFEIVFDARRTWEPGFEEYLWEGPISTCTHPYSKPTGGSHFSCPTTLDYRDSVAAALIREGHTHICSLNVDSCKQLFIIPPLLLFLTIHLLFQGVAHLNE